MNTSNLTPNQMNIEQLAIEQQPQIKPLWLVIDEQGYPIHCASYKEACNEHINDAINDFDLTEAKYWKVVEAVPKALQSSEPVVDVIKYVGTTEDTTQDTHPNDKEPRCDDLLALMKRMGDDAGQGLHPYWKWAMATGFNAAKRLYYTNPPSTVSLEEHNKRIAELEADIDTYVPIANQQATEIMQLQATNKTLLEAYKSAIQSIDDYDCYDRKTGNICFKHEIFKWDMEFILEIEGKNEQSFNSN